MKTIFLFILPFLFIVPAGFVMAEEPSFNPDLNYAQVVAVNAYKVGSTWTFTVTVEHRDDGWEHYADAWEIVNIEDGKVLARRILAHPHENEQPFTRSLAGVLIPEGVQSVLIRARCNVHGYGGRTVIFPVGDINR